MNVKRLVCVFIGHRWHLADDLHETYPIFRCRRCAKLQGRGGETALPEGWSERAGRAHRAQNLMDAQIQRRR